MDMHNTDSSVFLAIDLGASSGRLVAGISDGETLSLEEVTRFPTLSTTIGAHSYWNVLSLYSSIEDALAKAARAYGDQIVSIGVDTWGVDYGLLDESKELLSNPICYRDGRTSRYLKEVPERLGRELIYAETGIQFMFFNTLYQVAAEIGEGRSAFQCADRLLFLPDLLNFWLTGIVRTERSIASTSQMLNPNTGNWSEPILEALEVKAALLGEVVDSGASLGPLRSDLSEKTGLKLEQVTLVPGHDTACAFMALSSNEPGYAIMNSGTWSLMGLELKAPNCSMDALEAGFSNEIGYGGSVRFLKNICGLWLIEVCSRQWASEGIDMDYKEIVTLADAAEPMRSLFDPDDSRFAAPGDMVSRIAEYCSETGQPTPRGPGEVARSIFDSLALKYRLVFEQLKAFADVPLNGLHILGGGSRNVLLNQLTADALGVPVLAGPAEATALGNALAQMIASGIIENVTEGRELISRSFKIKRYEPRAESKMAESFDRFKEISNRRSTVEY